jgi:L-lactate dehydrogenase complex protein LldF
MSHVPTSIDFRANSQRVPPTMAAAVQKATTKFLGTRATLVEALGDDLWQALRQAGHEVRLHAITHLDHYLVQAERAVTGAGGHVHWARDAEEARRIVLDISAKHRVKLAVKSKSMASEEIGLNQSLEAAGIRVLETDLGEYILAQGYGTRTSWSRRFLSKEKLPALSGAALGWTRRGGGERPRSRKLRKSS